MEHSRWMAVKDIVQQALEREPSDRSEYLEGACGDDRELRREVETLLEVSETRASVFDDFSGWSAARAAVRLEQGDEIEHYTIVRSIGEGGMGVVYLADDTKHNRQVALKLLLPHTTRASSHEKEALARLSHSSIATLYGSGSTSDGLQYLVMEYVEGEEIDIYCARHHLGIGERLRLFADVCRAVHYAHSKLIAHRDLKPSNILVTEAGVPTLLDFGVAKLLSLEGAPTLTLPHERPLTIAFSSPEQLDGGETGIATDVYSLGVLLCVLLTARLPHQVESRRDLPWTIRRQDPVSPSSILGMSVSTGELTFGVPPGTLGVAKLRRQLEGDLDAIVLKALRHEPGERYGSVQELEDDIRRHINHEPVSALQGSRRYRVQKFARKHRAGVFAAVAALLGAGLFLTLLVVENRETARERDRAEAQTARAEEITRFVTSLLRLSDPYEVEPGGVTLEDILDRAEERAEAEFQDQAGAKGDVLATLAQIHRHNGDRERAIELGESALAARTAGYGLLDTRVASSLAELGGAYGDLGRHEEAAAVLQRGLGIIEKTSGTRSLDYAAMLSNLGYSLWLAGDLKDAEESYEQAVSLYRSLADQDSRDDMVPMVATLHNLASIRIELGSYDGTRGMHQEVLLLRRQLFGEISPQVANSYNELGILAEKEGDLAEAIRLHQKGLAITRQVTPDDDYVLAIDLNNLAYSLVNAGRYDEARALYLEAIQRGERALGERHEFVLRFRCNFAELHRQDGELHLAHDELVALLAQASAIFGLDHYYYHHISFTLGKVLLDLGRFQHAEEMAIDVIDAFQRLMPDDVERIADARGLLGSSLLERGRLEEAEPHLREAFEDGPRVSRAAVARQLVALYTQWRMPEKAEEYRDSIAGGERKPAASSERPLL